MEDNWSEVNTSQTKEEPKVEFEIEEKEKVEVKPEPVIKEEPKQEAPIPKEEPKELEGIETKGAEKRIRQLIRQRKERDEQINQLIHQNEKLKNSYTTKENEFHQVSKLNLDATEKQLKDKLELARTAYADAFEAQDKNKLLKAQESLNEAQTDLKNVAVTKSKFTEQPKERTQPAQQPVQQPVQADPRAVDWQSNNEWFGKDNIMTASALAIDAELKNEGYNPTDEDFYSEIDNRIRAAFPNKFENKSAQIERNDGSSTPSQVVAGGSRSSPNPKKVKLSQEDVRLASKWGIPLEQYAAEKMKVTKSEGDYTTINTQRGGK
jgi:hypothetical protein|tara:strand:+ start:162 stop:1127 length:966 start_codon:yes stop_codon:yes gene_type:complete